jgi:hypothetical protein
MSEHAFDRLVGELCLRVPMLEGPFAEVMLSEAAQEFTRTSTAWREVIEERTDSDGRAVGCVPSMGLVQFIAGVCDRDGRALKGWFQTGEEIRFAFPVPETDLLIELVLASDPGGTAKELPDEFLRLHYAALMEGALAYIFEQPAKPWSSLTLHGLHRRRFVKLSARARQQAQSHGNPHRSVVRIPYFGVDRQGYHG